MKNVGNDGKRMKPNAQLILMSGFIIMLGTLTFVTLLNSLILTANLPASGLDISKHDIKEFRSLVISEVNHATIATLQYSDEIDSGNETLLRNYFMNYTDDLSSAISLVYATRGAAVDVVINNVTFSSSITNRTITIQHFRQQPHVFPNKTLIIPMDEQQENPLKVYRFVRNVVNDTGIPVYQVIQNPVNMSNISSNPENMTNISIDEFYLNVTTDDIFRVSDGPGTVINRTYSGGAFLIDFSDLDTSTLNSIYNDSVNNYTPNITIHGLRQNSITLNTTLVMTDVPSVAIYPDSASPFEDYYADMDLPFYSLLNDNDILDNLTLENYSVLLIHGNMSEVDVNVTRKITNWTADGGVLYAEGETAVTMDQAVENIDNNTLHTWFGLIGILNSSNLSTVTSVGPYIKLINASSTLNENIIMPLDDLADPGASFNPLSQTDNISGMYGPSSEIMAFTLNETDGAVNPSANIIGYAAYPNGSQIIFDGNGDGDVEYHLAFVESPFGLGRVIYIAGNDLRDRGTQAERIAAAIFYASVSREELALEANNINVTISYSDGRADYSNTLLITI